MRFSKEMLLLSQSGYAMPFEDKEADITPSLAFGRQKHPKTGEEFFHHGCDFAAKRVLLSSVADGKVKDMGFDTTHGQFIVLRHGKYEVTYAHLSKVYATVGDILKAGNVVGVSDDMLHISTSYNDTELDPMAFLAMILQNLLVVRKTGKLPATECYSIDMDIKTDYDDKKDEVENLMMRYWADYYEAIGRGQYTTPERTQLSMQNLFTIGKEKELYGETPPSLLNPLGLWKRAASLIGRIQSLLIADFLNYLAITNQVYLSGTDADSKKKTIDEAIADGLLIDPLAGLDLQIQSFDIPRLVSVYPDRALIRWWTKLWINNHEEGEPSVEITREQALRFIWDDFDKDEWCEQYFPEQMKMYHNAIAQTREQLLQQTLEENQQQKI